MDALGLQQRVLELEGRLRTLMNTNRELEEKLAELMPRKSFIAMLNPGKALYWVEAA
jgi:hypothetical protein